MKTSRLSLLLLGVLGTSLPSSVWAAGGIDDKVKQHELATAELKTAQERFSTSLSNYERKKVEYESAIANKLQLSTADAKAIARLMAVSLEGNRVAQELVTAVTQLDEALRARAEAFRAQSHIEGDLAAMEVKALGSRAAALAAAAAEVKALHEAEVELREAQKNQQSAVGALAAREAEDWADSEEATRDHDADDALLKQMRSALDAAFAKLIQKAEQLDAAYDRIHAALEKAGAKLPPDVSAQRHKLVADRIAASHKLAGARQWLKETTLVRAEKRAQEILHDNEITTVVNQAFKKDAKRKAFRAEVKAERDAALVAREQLISDEKALIEARRSLLRIEAEIGALGY